MKKKLLCLLSLMAALTGCAVSVERPTTYTLKELPAKHISYRTGKILLVFPPEVVHYYRSTQIAYETKPYLIDYFTRNIWGATPSQMIQPLLVQSLQDTRHYLAVVTPPVSGYYHYALNTEVLALFVNYYHQPATFDIKLRAQLFNANSNKAIATKDIYISEPIRGCNNFYSKIIAANHAMARALRRVSQFSVKVIK